MKKLSSLFTNYNATINLTPTFVGFFVCGMIGRFGYA